MSLEQFRERIDGIDGQLIRLLAQRLDVCRQVAEYKQLHGIPTMQPGRVHAVLDRLGQLAEKLGLRAQFARLLWQKIIDEACLLEDELRHKASGLQTLPIDYAVSDRPVVTILGAGRVGLALASVLSDAQETVYLVDKAVPAKATHLPIILSDVTLLDDTAIAAVMRASCVVLALPLSAAKASIAAIAPHVGPGALVVETLSVKMSPGSWIEKLRADVEYLGINPLFAPDLPWRGRPLLVVEHRGGPRAKAFIGRLATTGCEVLELNAMEHDRMLAERQGASHAVLLAFGATLAESMGGRQPIFKGPPPYQVLLMMLGRLLHGNPQVYAEIQRENPFVGDVRRRLVRGLEDLNGSDSAALSRITHLQDCLASSLTPAARACAQVFEHCQLPAEEVTTYSRGEPQLDTKRG